jgi:hypothetical protein
MFIDSTYFVGEINIPNATQAPTSTALTQAIGQYEKEVLILLLGYKLYSLLVADCTLGVPATQIYKDLVDGKEFTHTFNGEDMTLKWEGLKNTSLQSLLAYYTFFKYVERDVTRLYGTGVSMAATEEKWQRVSAVNKLCAAWERMRELYGKIPLEYKPVYTRPILGTNLPYVFNADPSAYNFLFANKTDYPDWYFTPVWNINAFGI